jgi:hypothetical protein
MSTRTFGRPARTAALVGLATLLCAGCAVIERSEVRETTHLLTAAGFRVRPADTAEAQAQLAALPPHKLVAEPHLQGIATGFAYVYADPDECKCAYVGNASAYQTYRELAFQQRIADERELAAETNADATADWAPWGPGRWQPLPVP